MDLGHQTPKVVCVLTIMSNNGFAPFFFSLFLWIFSSHFANMLLFVSSILGNVVVVMSFRVWVVPLMRMIRL